MVVIQKFMLRSVEIDTACHSGPHREASSSVGRQKIGYSRACSEPLLKFSCEGMGNTE